MNKRSTFAKMFLVGAMLMGANCVALRAQINLEGTDAFKIDNLPLLRTGVQTHQFCSYDRAGDNYDTTILPSTPSRMERRCCLTLWDPAVFIVTT